MLKGTKYKIRYRLDNQRRDREGVAMYLGLNQNLKDYDFSGRPEFGTTSIPMAAISHMKIVPDNTQCYMDKKV
jgi:hypothetical protein